MDRWAAANTPDATTPRLRFVVQEHHARSHHFDFRLEKDGVYKSWAVPKGLPEVVGVKRLAVEVDDHDLAFGDFEGEIPAGQYGAGKVAIWDRGYYEPREWGTDRIEFMLYGQRLSGHYEMVRFRRAGEREWLVFKRSDSSR